MEKILVTSIFSFSHNVQNASYTGLLKLGQCDKELRQHKIYVPSNQTRTLHIVFAIASQIRNFFQPIIYFIYSGYKYQT